MAPVHWLESVDAPHESGVGDDAGELRHAGMEITSHQERWRRPRSGLVDHHQILDTGPTPNRRIDRGGIGATRSDHADRVEMGSRPHDVPRRREPAKGTLGEQRPVTRPRDRLVHRPGHAWRAQLGQPRNREPSDDDGPVDGIRLSLEHRCRDDIGSRLACGVEFESQQPAQPHDVGDARPHEVHPTGMRPLRIERRLGAGHRQVGR